MSQESNYAKQFLTICLFEVAKRSKPGQTIAGVSCPATGTGQALSSQSSIVFCSGKQIAKRVTEEPKKLTIWKCVNVGGRLEISFFGEPTYDNWSTRRCTVTTIRSAGGLFLSRMGEALEMISSGISLFLFPCQIGLIILVVKVAR